MAIPLNLIFLKEFLIYHFIYNTWILQLFTSYHLHYSCHILYFYNYHKLYNIILLCMVTNLLKYLKKYFTFTHIFTSPHVHYIDIIPTIFFPQPEELPLTILVLTVDWFSWVFMKNFKFNFIFKICKLNPWSGALKPVSCYLTFFKLFQGHCLCPIESFYNKRRSHLLQLNNFQASIITSYLIQSL